jgi:hypothetical protein
MAAFPLPARQRAARPLPLRHKTGSAAAVCIAAAALWSATDAQARITRFEVTQTESPTFGGYAWPEVGAYEKIVGIAHGEVNPKDPKNAVIADIALAPRNARGNVEYSFDFYILKPIDLKRGAHKMMYEPPNRGRKTWNTFGRVPAGNDPGSITDPAVLANTFLMPRGFTVVWSGWDKSAGASNANFNTTITLPVAKNADGSTITGPSYEYIVSSGTSFELAYPAATLDKSKAKLTHRVHLDDVPIEIPASGWDYNATGTAIGLAGGAAFVANDIYEFSYTAKDPTVNGLGFAAVRDFNAWLRDAVRDDAGNPNPLARDVRHIYTEVVSQPGRFLNDFRHLGFNQAENGKKVFDGLMQWIAAGNGLNLNYRFSQPGRTERNRQDHLYAEGVFPFANVTTTDPFTGKHDSRLERCEHTHTCPVAAEIYSANEYWVKTASLLHTTPDGRRDLPDSRYARNYFISSHQHGVGNATTKGSCQQFQNPLDSAPVQRALFVALDEWVHGRQPPKSRVPRLRDGTFAPPLPQWAVGFPEIPGVTYTGLKTTRYLFDYGPQYYTKGIATINPPLVQPPYQSNPANGPIYPSWVPRTDRDGNDIAGVRLVDVSVPLATYTGWALRAGAQANDGCEAAGQFIPFAKTLGERQTSGDPRLSVAERYPTFAHYQARVRRALDTLVKQRLFLCEDVEAELNRLYAKGVTMGVPAPAAGVPAAEPLPRCSRGHHQSDSDDEDDDRDDHDTRN